MIFRQHVLRNPDGGEGGNGGGEGAPEVVTFQDGDQTYAIPRTAIKGWIPEKDVNERYVPKAAHNDQMARLRREAEGLKGRRSEDDLLADEGFRTKAITHWNLDPNAGSKQLQTALERQKSELYERELKPTQTKLERAHAIIDSLLTDQLTGQIVNAAREAGVDERFLKPAMKGGKPLIVAMTENAYEFDPEHGQWFARGASEQQPFAFSAVAGEVPYMGVDEHMRSWIETEAGKNFRKDQRQQGAGANAGQGQGSGPNNAPGVVGNELRVTRAQYTDINYMRKAQERAAKEGLTIVPIN